MDMKELERTLIKEWAIKAMESLDEEKKQELIATAIFNQLDRSNFDWNVRDIFKDYANNYANEYIQQEKFQLKIKQKAHEAIDKNFDLLIEKMSEDFARNLKWSAEKISK